jgi:carbamoyl-phosphate synthase small subunit
MTGYQEIFTDPSYYGQIMVATNAHIGNYGVNENEVESDGIKISGLVCKISVSITLELIPLKV